MIYFCVSTSEYLTDILDRVSLGASHYLLIDIQRDKAQKLVDKFAHRYDVSINARQRTYRKSKSIPVFDLIILENESMQKIDSMRFCLIATLPFERRALESEKLWKYIADALELDTKQFERFYNVSDRKNRLIFNSITNHPVYELVELPYTKEERKQKEISKESGWTWRIHKKFVKLKLERIENAFKEAQKLKEKEKQDAKILKEMEILWGFVGFRGVRDDIFTINSKLRGLTFKYLNRKCTIELKVPTYQRKTKRSVKM